MHLHRIINIQKGCLLDTNYNHYTSLMKIGFSNFAEIYNLCIMHVHFPSTTAKHPHFYRGFLLQFRVHVKSLAMPQIKIHLMVLGCVTPKGRHINLHFARTIALYKRINQSPLISTSFQLTTERCTHVWKFWNKLSFKTLLNMALSFLVSQLVLISQHQRPSKSISDILQLTKIISH